jgi:lysyl-tRNA synthetase class 2
MTTASILSDFWNNQILADEKQGLFLVLVGFILSFAFIRMSTRLMRSPRVPWWPGSVVSDGGVHLHHLVFGIVTMMLAGTLGLAALGDSPLTEICAFFFGVGAGLTIDEFALWVYLDDVYWAEEGRASIDATVIAAAGMMLILLGFSPFSFDTSSFEQTIASILGAAFVFGLVAICFAKQRVLHGTIGFFIFPIAIYGAVRIGKPGSPWGRRRYGERNPAKQVSAEERFAPDRHTERFKNAFRDIVGGKPSDGVSAVTEEALATTREAVKEVREGVERVTRPGGPADKTGGR